MVTMTLINNYNTANWNWNTVTANWKNQTEGNNNWITKRKSSEFKRVGKYQTILFVASKTGFSN